MSHMAMTEPITRVSPGAWNTTIDWAMVTWHPLVPLEPDVVKEKQFPKGGSIVFPRENRVDAEQDRGEGADERCLLYQNVQKKSYRYTEVKVGKAFTKG